jgi:hypothetical protein
VPVGKYILFVWYKYKEKTYGKFLDINLPMSLEKKIADLKGIPMTPEEILNLESTMVEGKSTIYYYCYDSERSSNSRSKKKSKLPYNFLFSLSRRTGRQSTAYTPDAKSMTFLYVIDEKGKIVIKKKMKTKKCAKKGLRGKLMTGTYLVISWCDLTKDKRLGTCGYLTKGN